jgi:hypothetical protein
VLFDSGKRTAAPVAAAAVLQNQMTFFDSINLVLIPAASNKEAQFNAQVIVIHITGLASYVIFNCRTEVAILKAYAGCKTEFRTGLHVAFHVIRF